MSKNINKLLIIRFKALGDVAMTFPVIESLSRQYPNLSITILSQPVAALIYNSLLPPNSNIHVKGINLIEYKGIKGLNRLYKELKKEGFDAVADLHDVIRSKWLVLRFKIDNIPVSVINKGRKEKKRLVTHTQVHQLPSSFIRYKDTIQNLGFNFEIDYNPSDILKDEGQIVLNKIVGKKCDEEYLIGVAPFAQHQGKIYPLEMMEKVIELILQRSPKIRVFLFGSPSEKEFLQKWTSKSDRIINCAGQQTLSDDLALMSKLDVVISMDSANMHLASLVGTQVISIWGATHPFAGFLGYKQDINNAIQLPLICRPCSIFGNKPCILGTYACLTNISPEKIEHRVWEVISQKDKK